MDANTTITSTEDVDAILAGDSDSAKRRVASCEDIKLAPNQLDMCLSNKSVAVILATIKRKDIKGLLSEGQIKDGINHANNSVRIAFASSDAFQINSQLLARCLKDKSTDVILAAIKRKDIKGLLSERQIKDGINHTNNSVRIAFASSDAFQINSQLLARCLKDKSTDVILAAIERKDIKGLLNERQIRNGLSHENSSVRVAFALNAVFTPNAQQIEDAISDKSSIIKEIFLKRSDIKLTQNQINRGLSDSDPKIKALTLSRPECKPSREQVNALLEDTSSIVRASVARCDKISLTKSQIDIGKQSEEGWVRKLFLEREENVYLLMRGIDEAFKEASNSIEKRNARFGSFF